MGDDSDSKAGAEKYEVDKLGVQPQRKISKSPNKLAISVNELSRSNKNSASDSQLTERKLNSKKQRPNSQAARNEKESDLILKPEDQPKDLKAVKSTEEVF